jgi:hypothetical protein
MEKVLAQCFGGVCMVQCLCSSCGGVLLDPQCLCCGTLSVCVVVLSVSVWC